MNIRYYIDPVTKLPHIYNHSVFEDEVTDIILKPVEDRQGKNNARVAIGQTQTGRYLRVIYVMDSKSCNIFVITAFELKGKPLIAYKRRRQKKQ